MNEDLAEPVMRAVATHWEHVLVAQLARQLDQLEMACIASVAAAGTAIEAALTGGADVGAGGTAACAGETGKTGTGGAVAAGVVARLRGMRESAEQRVRAGLARAKAEARALVQARQKELTRSITPQV